MGDCPLWCGTPHISLRIFILTAGRAWKSFPFWYESTSVPTGDPGLIPGLGSSPGEGKGYPLQCSRASVEAQLVKNPPAMWETPA